MPSPLRGMDPFIEGQKWKGFHTQFVTALGQSLIPHVRPQYVVDVEEYVYLCRDEEPERVIAPDVSVAETEIGWRESGDGGGVVTLKPVVRTLPMPRRVRQHYLVLRNRHSQTIVTVIELLSPWNKRAGDGQTEYLTKRENVLATPASLVELDLLRGGLRLPTVEPLPDGDYHAFVSRSKHRALADVYTWSLRDRLPRIPVPLAEGDADVIVDLQEVFTTTYDRAGYDYALDYKAKVEPPLSEADAQWARELLATRSSP